MGRGRSYAIMGYGPAVNGSRRVFCANSLVEAYQETIKAAREAVVIVEWTWKTQAGRKMLGLTDPMDHYVKAPLPRPKGLVKCPRGPCVICRWSGETTNRVLSRYQPWQLKEVPCSP